MWSTLSLDSHAQTNNTETRTKRVDFASGEVPQDVCNFKVSQEMGERKDVWQECLVNQLCWTAAHGIPVLFVQ